MRRRSFLEVGTLALGGLSLSDVLRSRAEAKAAGRKVSDDTAVILIWLQGGPSHMETYDLKPDAPAEYRGECQPISTVTPGMDVCEHLPRHAQVADRFNLIRSISHGFANHAGGAGRFLSGYDPKRPLDPQGSISVPGASCLQDAQGAPRPRRCLVMSAALPTSTAEAAPIWARPIFRSSFRATPMRRTSKSITCHWTLASRTAWMIAGRCWAPWIG